MRKAMVFLVLLMPVTFYALSDGPLGQDYIVIHPDFLSEIPEYNLFGEGENIGYSGFIEEDSVEINAVKDPVPYAPLWWDDILVTDQCVLTPRYDIGFDYDSDGNLYVALLSSNSVNDTIKIYRSTDRGIHWDEIFTLNFNPSIPVCFKDFDFRVSRNDPNPDLILAWVDSCYNSHNKRFWFGRIDATTHVPDFFLFDTSNVATRNVNYLSMDINELADPYVVITYSNDAIYWRTVLTQDNGLNWTYFFHTTAPNLAYLYCAFSDAANFHTAVVMNTNNSILLRNGTTGGAYSYHWLNDTSDHTIRTQLKISADKQVVFPSNNILAVWRQGLGSDSRIYQNVSTDAGQNWSGESIHPLVGDVYAGNPFVRFGQNNTALFTFLDFQFAQDSLCACVYSVYTGWGGKTYINDHNPSGLLPAVGSYVSAGGIYGRVVAYRQYAANQVWFDRWNYTSTVEEQKPENSSDVSITYIPCEGKVLIKFTAVSGSRVLINVYDILGREVYSIFDGIAAPGDHILYWNLEDTGDEKISSGRYFICFASEGFNRTKSLIVY